MEVEWNNTCTTLPIDRHVTYLQIDKRLNGFSFFRGE